jgi:hypothetical protein
MLQHRSTMSDLPIVEFSHVAMMTRACDSPGHTACTHR